MIPVLRAVRFFLVPVNCMWVPSFPHSAPNLETTTSAHGSVLDYLSNARRAVSPPVLFHAAMCSTRVCSGASALEHLNGHPSSPAAFRATVLKHLRLSFGTSMSQTLPQALARCCQVNVSSLALLCPSASRTAACGLTTCTCESGTAPCLMSISLARAPDCG